MKTLRKILCLTVCVLLACTAFAGCTRTREGDEAVDPNRVQLYVGNFNGGYGSAWLYDVKKRFEEKYKDVDFGEGKTGVQVMIESEDKYSGGQVKEQIEHWPQHVILSEAADYYQLVGTAKKSFVRDITDVVTTPLNYDFILGGEDPSLTETHTIEKIMNPSMKEYFKQTGTNKYFGVPFYEATVGFVYDIDLFEEYGFFYCADGYGDGEGFMQDKSGNWIGQNGAVLGAMTNMSFAQATGGGIKLSAGPDGKEDTYDDGMPATYDEFFALCERIEERGLEALTWPGSREIHRYLNYLAYNLWADYEGKEQMELNYSLNGRALDLIDLDSFDSSTGTFTTYEQDINNSNGYLLNTQAGKYYAVDFVKRLVSNTKCYDETVCFGENSQYTTETLFVNSAKRGKRRAMMVDGSWWQSEASKIFTDMVEAEKDESQKDKWKAENRRFGMLALPKATKDKVGKGNTLAFNTTTSILVNRATTQNETIFNIAKQFIKFMHTHESLYQFNKITASAKPYEYELSESELATLTSVAKQNYEMHCSIDYVYSYSQNPILMLDPQSFASSGYTVFQNEKSEEILTWTFQENPSLTGWDNFKSIANNHGKTWWDEHFKAWF